MKTDEDYYIETYGLKTHRNKKQLKRWGQDKILLKTERELNELKKQKKNMPLIELEKPMQIGWKRFYILRSDIIKSDESAFYQNILNRINTETVCNRKDFMKKNYKTKKLEPIPQHTKWLCKYDFEKLNFSMKEEQLFEYKWVRDNSESRKYKAFVYLCDWQFEFRIKKNIITHVQAHDADLEKRIAELDKEVYSFKNQNRLSKIHGTGVYRYWKNDRIKSGIEKPNTRWWLSHIEDDN